MATYKRNDIDKLLKSVEQGKPSSVYLIVGERYLCRQVADKLISVLIPEPIDREQGVKRVDGEQEDFAKTLASLKTYSMFSGKRIIRVSDTRLFLSKAVAKKIWERAQNSFAQKELRRSLLYLQQLADIAQQDIENLDGLSENEWKKAFSFAKPQELSWLQKVVSLAEGPAQQERVENDPADLFMEAFEAGIPDTNTLVLLAETVDKRKKFYKFIAKHGVVADLTVVAGSSKAARTDQESVLKALINNTLAEFGKTIEPSAISELLDRVGFHPVAVVRETEKLALFAGDEPVITLQNLKEIVGRTREDALYELTEAYVDKNLNKSLLITKRLFNEGTHPLVLVSGLRNQLKKILLIRSMRESTSPPFVTNMSYGVFQKGYLPELKEEKSDWLDQLPTHPYALYMMFEKAGQYTVKSLMAKMSELLRVEHRLKSSSVSPQILFERFLYGTI